MAGDVKVAVVTATLSPGGTGTKDFTKLGFGTPKACIILVSDTISTVSPDPEGKISIGLSNFTDNYCITHQDKDASAKVDCAALKSNTKSYVILDESGTVEIDGAATTITDGVRLTNTTNTNSRAARTTIIMFGGADLGVSLQRSAIASAQNGTATIAHSGEVDGNDKLIFFIGSDISAEDSANSGINNKFGVCHATGSDAAAGRLCSGAWVGRATMAITMAAPFLS
ncbi:hypothetical protein LCGC14_1934570 [marine sediment metagenome]|uniref:Uncharacterized protein n=1 Tax=marine sediment metagenome TaxID=412755 RepID=A0A0F9I0Q0_9ZZZZ